MGSNPKQNKLPLFLDSRRNRPEVHLRRRLQGVGHDDGRGAVRQFLSWRELGGQRRNQVRLLRRSRRQHPFQLGSETEKVEHHHLEGCFGCHQGQYFIWFERSNWFKKAQEYGQFNNPYKRFLTFLAKEEKNQT